MVCYYKLYHSESIIFRVFPSVRLKDGVDSAMLFTLWASLFELRPNTLGFAFSYDPTR